MSRQTRVVIQFGVLSADAQSEILGFRTDAREAQWMRDERTFVPAIGGSRGPAKALPRQKFWPQGVIGGAGSFLGSTGLTRRR